MELLGVEYAEGCYRVNRDGALHAITHAGVPVGAFLPGWQACYAVADTGMPTVLALRHDSGARAVWYLDADDRFVANAADGLPEPQRRTLEAAFHRAAGGIGARFIRDEDGAGLPGRADNSFIQAMIHDRTLPDPLAALLPSAAEAVVLEDMAGARDAGAAAAMERAHGAALDPEHLSAFFRQDLLGAQIRAIRDGYLTMPSPFDGAPLVSDRTWCLEPTDGFAVHFRTPVRRDGFFAVMFGFEMAVTAVYFPGLNLMLYLNPHMRDVTRRFLGEQPERALWRHALGHADGVAAAQDARPTPALVCSYEHVGHHLWNELTGLHATVQQIPAERLPRVIVVNPAGTEMYGKLDELFPEFACRVSRVADVRALTEMVYADRLLPLRPTGNWVGRDLAGRLSRRAAAAYLTTATACVLEGLRAKGFRLVLLGLRVENRTVVDFPAFCGELIDMLAAELGKVAVIVDGQNRSETGHAYRVTLQDGDDDLPLRLEHDIVAGLSARFADNPNVMLISTIGAPVGVSVALAARAEFFVTPWGAGLAKYRWVCNRPGLVLAGPSCERFQPLHLYDDPRFMEAPAPIYFMPPGAIEDAPDDARLFGSGNDDRVNIRVDSGALRTRLREMIHELAQIASRAGDSMA